MEADQASYNGAVDWNFPATPTNAASSTTPNTNNNVYHTPKTASFPSHFHDAFATPQMPSYTPRQPEFPNMAAVQRQSTADYYAHMQINAACFQTSSMMSPIYDNDTSPPQTAQPPYDTTQMQMQTPPPTRASSVRKPQLQHVAFGTPSTIATRRFASPQVGPMQHPQIHFSPDMYQFCNFGPASAPVMPQTQLLWAQIASPVALQQQQQQPRLDDPFAPTPSLSTMRWSQAPMQQTAAPSTAFNTPAMNSFPLHAAVQRPASAVHLSHSQILPMTATSVDPSLVYSSPVQPPPKQPAERPRSRRPGLQESAMKTASNRKDGGNVDKKKATEHKRTDTIMTSSSVASTASSATASSRPSLQRSYTTGTARTQPAQTLTGLDSLDRRSSVLQVPRTSSPLKRIGRPNLGSISESRKARPPSVILTVDESGRAHVVRTEVPRDNSPARAMRERYPGLYDSDSSDEEFNEDESTPSRSASFSFSRGQERLPKVAKLDTSTESLDGLSIPRTSSAASFKVTTSRAAISAAAQLRRGNSLRKRTPSRNGQRRVTSSSASLIDAAPMDISQDRRQSVIGSDDFNRGLTLSSRGSFELDAHNRRWSMMSLEHQHSISPTHLPQFSEMSFAQSGLRQ